MHGVHKHGEQSHGTFGVTDPVYSDIVEIKLHVVVLRQDTPGVIIIYIAERL